MAFYLFDKINKAWLFFFLLLSSLWKCGGKNNIGDFFLSLSGKRSELKTFC